MTASTVDQPSPVVSAETARGTVVAYVEALRRDDAYVAIGTATDALALVLSDVRARADAGSDQWSALRAAQSDRDPLLAAYREMLDACDCLAAELDEHGVDPTDFPTELFDEVKPSDRKKWWHLHDVQQLFTSQVRQLIQLRALIEERTQEGSP